MRTKLPHPEYAEIGRGPERIRAIIGVRRRQTRQVIYHNTGATSLMSTRDVILAYRRLYQHGLRAIQYAKPQRYTFRDRLRQAFRRTNREDFDQSKVDKTFEFLDGAAREKGLEHKILKNLLHVWWCQDQPAQLSSSSKSYADSKFTQLCFLLIGSLVSEKPRSSGGHPMTTSITHCIC